MAHDATVNVLLRHVKRSTGEIVTGTKKRRTARTKPIRIGGSRREVGVSFQPGLPSRRSRRFERSGGQRPAVMMNCQRDVRFDALAVR
jgi:hypothetical protein